MRLMPMKKAEELIDRLNEMAEAQNTISDDVPAYELGDIVYINRDGFEYTAMVEAYEGDKYTVRVQAVAGNEFEATDKVYVVEEGELSAYEADTRKMWRIGDVVTWKSMAGITLGEIVGASEDASGNYIIEVYAKGDGDQIEPTHVTVNLSGNNLSVADVALPERKRGQILSKMSDVALRMDDERKVGIIEGMASTYGNVDLGGDTVKKGAFKQTLKHKGGKVKLFADHGWDMKTFMGIAYLEDSEDGLAMKAEMPLDASDVKDNFIKVKFAMDKGEDMGLSIGYEAIKSKYLADGTRELSEISVFEVSMTPFPMDTHAKILSARSKRIANMAMQSKWATPIIDAPASNQDKQGAALLGEALVAVKQLIKNNKTVKQ